MNANIESAIHALQDYAANAKRIAENANTVSTLLKVLVEVKDLETATHVKERIADHLANLAWNADPDLPVGESSLEGYENIDEEVKMAVAECHLDEREG